MYPGKEGRLLPLLLPVRRVFPAFLRLGRFVFYSPLSFVCVLGCLESTCVRTAAVGGQEGEEEEEGGCVAVC